MKRRVSVTVTGKVQGVNFRRCTEQTAKSLGVNGWVMNLLSGQVEGCFEGDSDAVNSLVDWCRTGPPSGKVESLDIQEQPFTGEFTGFQVRR